MLQKNSVKFDKNIKKEFIEPLKKEDVLKNSSDVFEGQIRLPKVVK